MLDSAVPATLRSDSPAPREEEATLGDSGLPATPGRGLYARGRAMLETGAQTIAGISLNNPHFGKDGLAELLRGCAGRDLCLMITDGPARHNYEALGLAESSLRRELLNLHRLLRRAMEECARGGASEPARLSVVSWPAVYAATSFRERRAEMQELYRSSPELREDIAAASRRVLAGMAERRGMSWSPDDAVLERASGYVLDECAFILAAPDLLGVAGCVYIYHQPWPLLERLLLGGYGGSPDGRVGLALSGTASPAEA